MTAYREFYRDRPVLITGGLGFIGSNLARQLVALGARVLIVDSLIPDYGGNLFNIDGIEDRVRVNIADIRQQSTMNDLVRGHDVIFNLAGQVSHIDSMQDPYTDLEINCRGQLSCSKRAVATTPPSKWCSPVRGRSTGAPTHFQSPKIISCGRQTSTGSTRRQASTTISSTTTCSASARARCG